jgi:hypothetical protein
MTPKRRCCNFISVCITGNQARKPLHSKEKGRTVRQKKRHQFMEMGGFFVITALFIDFSPFFSLSEVITIALPLLGR